jgi:hypothetical protein
VATPLTALFRITLTYVVAGLSHKVRAYVRPVAVGAQPWVLNDRTNTPMIITWRDVALGWWLHIFAPVMTSSVPGASAVLEQFVAGLWQPIDFYSVVQVGLDPAPPTLAEEATYVIRDTAFKKIRVILLETTQGYLGHSNTGMGVTGSFDVVTPYLNGATPVATSPWNWQVSRGNRYFLAAGAIAGLTLDQNRKLKRARHQE